MNTQLLITFIIFNIINVIIQTVKSLATIKCGKTVAAVVNAIAYGLYTYIVVLTVCDLPLWLKVAVVGGANLIGGKRSFPRNGANPIQKGRYYQ